MNFKKVAGVLLSCVLAGVALTGCGEDTDQKSAGDSQVIRVGMIKQLNISEQKLDELLQKIQEETPIKLSSHKTTFYDNLNSMLMGAESKSVDEISVYDSVGKYIIGKNDKFEVAHPDALMELKDSFCFAVLKDNKDLKSQLDETLKEIRTDGTLDKLTKEYITDLKQGEEPPAVQFEKFDGADTIKVAVTGDLPPLDLVLSNGQPAGFNTALLAEVGKRLHKNIETIQIDSVARASALTSNNADVVFWAIIPVGNERPSNMDVPAELDLSTPYFVDKIIHLDLKK